MQTKTVYGLHFLLFHQRLLYRKGQCCTYRIGLPSKTATAIALFVGMQLLCFCSRIRQQTCVATSMFNVLGGNGLAVSLSGNTRSRDLEMCPK